MRTKPNGEPVAIYYAWVCGYHFNMGPYECTLIPGSLCPVHCIVCGASYNKHFRQVPAYVVADIFSQLEEEYGPRL